MTGSKCSTSSTKSVFCKSIRQQRWPSWFLIGLDNFSSATAACILTKLDSRQGIDIYNQVYVFHTNLSTKMATWSPIGLDILDLFLKIAKTDLDKT